MNALPGTDLVPLIIAASGLKVTPVGVDWPLHRALTGLGVRNIGTIQATFGDLELHKDREIGLRSRLADNSWAEVACSTLLRCEGSGLVARWRVDEQTVTQWRRRLFGVHPSAVRALAHAGKRWATLSETILKNLDMAAESWASSTSVGETSLPIVRQPVLMVRR